MINIAERPNGAPRGTDFCIRTNVCMTANIYSGGIGCNNIQVGNANVMLSD